jgi:uncharacterized protein YdhG (YjbR/CyaY superfamily)
MSRKLTPEERAAMKAAMKDAEGEQAVKEAFAKMTPADRALGKKVHALVRKAAPGLMPRTWYGMPAYSNADGKVVIFFRDAAKFKERYAMIGFQDSASLDRGAMWPVAYALTKLSPADETKLTKLVKQAVK